jgi:hypothetical protein
MKIALCRPGNVPRLIDAVAGQELVCLGRLQDLKRLSDEAGDSRNWSRLMGTLAAEAEIAFWNSRIEWLQRARDLLEQLRDEHEESPFGPGTAGSAALAGRLRRV